MQKRGKWESGIWDRMRRGRKVGKRGVDGKDGGGGIKIRKGGGGSVYCMNVNIKWSGIEIKDYNWTSALLCSSILYSLYILVYICIF